MSSPVFPEKDEFKCLEHLKLTAPCEGTVRQLEEFTPTQRSKALASLNGPPGHCVWCGLTPLPGLRKRWCSEDCLISAEMRCYPQRPACKLLRLIYIQNCACARCGQCFEDRIRKRIRDKWRWLNRPEPWLTGPRKISLVTLFHLGYDTGHIWQVDHITPIWAGGHGTDPANIQVLCVQCHKEKTALEAGRRGKSE